MLMMLNRGLNTRHMDICTGKVCIITLKYGVCGGEEIYVFLQANTVDSVCVPSIAIHRASQPAV